MRILHIGKYYPPFSGGIENFMAALLPEQVNAGHAVAAVVHHHQSGRGFSSEMIAGVYVCRVPIYGKLLYTPLSPLFGHYLNKVIKDFKPDLLHIHMPNVSAFWTLLDSSCKQLPIVVHWHSDVITTSKQARLALAYKCYRPFETRLLTASKTIIATSPPYLASSRPLQAFQAKSQIIPLGLSKQDHPQSTNRLSGQYWDTFNDCLKLLCVGRLTYYKGHEYLLRALARSPDVQAVIVGSGDQHNRLIKLVNELNLASRVKLYGSCSDAELDELMSGCDCLCLPSIERTEAFGLVLLEAMRKAKPAIVTDVPGSGMSWVVKHGLNGLVAKAEDESSLAEAIAYLRDNPGERQAMGQAGWHLFQNDFTINKITEQTLSLYESLLYPK